MSKTEAFFLIVTKKVDSQKINIFDCAHGDSFTHRFAAKDRGIYDARSYIIRTMNRAYCTKKRRFSAAGCLLTGGYFCVILYGQCEQV